MSIKPEDVDGILAEKIRDLKQSRGHAKGNITKKHRETQGLMKDMDNVDLVMIKLDSLRSAVDNFSMMHKKYHELLQDESAVRDSVAYYESVIHEYRQFEDEAADWTHVASRLQEAAKDIEQEQHVVDKETVNKTVHTYIKDEDNPSVHTHVTKKGDNASVTSSRSKSSSIASAKAKVAAKKASLLAEAAAMAERRNLEREELLLKQKKRDLEIKVEIAKADAEEHAYSDIEIGEKVAAQADGMNRYYDNANHILSWKQDVELKADKTLDPDAQSWQPPQVMISDSKLHKGSIKGNSSHSSEELLHIIHQGQLQQQKLIETIQLPKTKLQEFDGDPLQYWTFMRSFENTVDKQSIDANAKLTRLLQYCIGKARKVIQCCSVIEPEFGYIKAKGLLKERFGNDYVIVESWIEKISGGANLKGTDRVGLQDFSDDLQNCFETLAAMDKISEISNQRSLVQIVQKLPIYLQNRWRKKAHGLSKIFGRVSFKDIVNFVQEAAEEANDPVFGQITDVHKDRQQTAHKGKFSRPEKKKMFSFNTQSDQNNNSVQQLSTNNRIKYRVCPLCGYSHTLFGCDEFKKMSIENRLKLVYDKKLCNNCLLPGHYAFRCYKDTTCTVTGCGRKHTRFLHQPKARTDIVGETEQNKSTPNLRPNNTPIGTSGQAQNGFVELDMTTCNVIGAGNKTNTSTKIALPIVPVRVGSSDGSHFVDTFALLDSGSTNTFCSTELVTALGAHGTKEKLSLTTLEQESIVTDATVVSLVVADRDHHNYIDLPRVYVRPMLPIHIEKYLTSDDVNRWPHLHGLDLPHCDNRNVMLLIGQDVPDALVPIDVRKGDKGAPYATRTLLGWSLNGPLGMESNHKAVVNYVQAETRLEHQVENFWKVEASELQGETKSGFSVNDERAVSIWNETICHDKGHYEMGIPFKQQPPSLPNNKSVAEHRLELLGKRLKKDPELCVKYCTEIHDLLDKGYAQKVQDDQSDKEEGPTWYLPHHPVIHQKKLDKVRIVFDCAAKYLGTSLNDQVLKGPDFMNNLLGILIRFREERIAMMSDIEGMFHQVRVNPKDCDVLRFLWWDQDDPNKKSVEYKMVVHLFGGVWSPSCSGFALKRTAEDNCDDFDQETVDTVNRNFYVDDCLKSVKCEQQAIRLANQLCHLLARGGFRLTKWVSNNIDVLKSIPEERRAKDFKTLDFNYETLPTERALGMQWDVELDQFAYKIVIKDKPITKRGILSVVSSVYDPLGFVSPFILPAKRILQELCRQKLGWDDPIHDKERSEWINWLNDLTKIEQFRIDRCMKSLESNDIELCQLHHFSDASLTGYGVVSYIRLVDSDGRIHCSLIMGKCRLAPIKQMTIPRLELAAATLAVKVDKFIRQEIDMPVHESVFWTDSMLVLQYIENEDKRFQTFIANRVAVIHEASSPSQWHYVESATNPADDASRGLSADELVKSDRWRFGPDFLWCDECDWPTRPHMMATIPVEEIRKSTQIYTITSCEPTVTIDDFFKRYSSWFALKRSVAWILRVKKKLQAKISKDPSKNVMRTYEKYLTMEELREAEDAIVKYVQGQCFNNELQQIEKLQDRSATKKLLKKSSALFRLEPVKSQNGILCVGGRLENAPICAEAKYPKILPKNHHIVDLVIQHYHQLYGHSGREHVLALIRQQFWIISGRAAVSRVLKKCFDCKRRTAPVGVQRMADLPWDRVTPNKPPFSYVGLDYFGPYLVSRGRSLVKRYGCVFTCLTTRAIHIEIAHSMDSSSFIDALHRFICRRGNPEEIRSDNGSNLVGAEKELRLAIAEWNQGKIGKFLLQRNISWKFNPPAASHMGGIWERQIRTIKKVLGAVLKEQTLNDESLSTLMCQVEAIINSRPITVVSDDVKDPEPLTPNHLLLLRSGPELPPGIFAKDDLYSRRRWKHVQYLADIFWRRWLKEYLPLLHQRQKWILPKRNLATGDTVLMVDENTPRSLWPLGRVMETYPGRDGLVRAVQVKTARSVLVRPVDKLCLLESVDG